MRKQFTEFVEAMMTPENARKMMEEAEKKSPSLDGQIKTNNEPKKYSRSYQGRSW